MEIIEKEHREIQKNNPRWSSHTCFLHAIRGKKLKDEEVKGLFIELVDRKDYSLTGIDEVLEYAISQTNL